jgi:hypothetical protein
MFRLPRPPVIPQTAHTAGAERPWNYDLRRILPGDPFTDDPPDQLFDWYGDDLAGLPSGASPDDPTMEQQPQPVVGEVAEAMPDPFDLLDDQVHGLGRVVGAADGGMPGKDFGIPGSTVQAQDPPRASRPTSDCSPTSSSAHVADLQRRTSHRQPLQPDPAGRSTKKPRVDDLDSWTAGGNAGALEGRPMVCRLTAAGCCSRMQLPGQGLQGHADPGRRRWPVMPRR